MKLPRLNPRELPQQAVAFARTPRARRLLWWIMGVIVAIGVLGALVTPPILRWQLEEQLSRVLHRKVTVEAVRINPYTLEATVRGVKITERGGDAVAFSVDELYADVSSASLYRRAPVLAAVRVVKPRVHVVRTEANRYNWSDLIDEWLAKPVEPNQPPPRFALANIELVDGAVNFDDRPEDARHVVDAIHLAVPFASSLPVHQEILVEPRFSARVDGTPVELFAKARPFKETHDSTLNLDVRGLDLTRFLDYIPGELPAKILSARLEADLDITFSLPKTGAPALVIAGKAALLDLDVQEPSGAPILKLPRLAAELRAIEPFAYRFDIARIALEAPELWVNRRKGGEIYLLRLFEPRATAGKPEVAAAGTASPLSYKIDEIVLADGKIEALDERGARPVRLNFDAVRATITELSGAAGSSARFDLAMQARTRESLALAGSFGLQPLQATGTLRIERARLPALWPYVEPFLALDAAGGELDVATAFTYSAAGDTPNLELREMHAALRSFTLRQRGDKQDLLRMPSLALRGGELNLNARTVKLGELAASGGYLAVRRDRDGIFNLQKLAAAAPAAGAGEAPADTQTAGTPWVASLRKLALERYALTVEDEAAGPAATANIENLGLTASELSTTRGQTANIALNFTLNKTGSLAASGPVTFTPPSARLKLEAKSLGIIPVQPYFERFVNAIVSSGDITALGDAAFDLPEGGSARASFKGDVTLANFAAVAKSGNEDLLRWKSLHLGGIDTSIEPLRMRIAEIALTDFYTRLVVTPEGRLNLQDLLAGSVPAQPDPAKPATAAPAAAKPAAPAGAAAASAQPAPDISIGKVSLAGGNVNFSDYFIKPNYSANLTGVTGGVSAITRETAGDLELRAHIDNTAPVEITGKVNPLARDLFLDLKASARDIDLPPFTPYAAKYAGYGIERGKLSMNVTYRLENRKLSAQNNVILNQLTFGEKIESPTATKLPVLFVVSLLKDRNGVINIDLPISGSIDDPQFSLGGIIGRVIVNLIVRIVTSPFALIGSLFGGGSGEELAYVEFAPGSAALNSGADAKLRNIAKALADRPALKLDIAGRVDPEVDREGLKRVSLERKVKSQKLKETVQGGASAGALEQVVVEPGEYAKYLARAYDEEKFPKPRNMIGLAKELPVPEMEQLMLTHTQVSDEDLRILANQRAQRVKDYLVETGKIEAERVFLLAPRLSGEGIKDKGKPTRVDFALK